MTERPPSFWRPIEDPALRARARFLHSVGAMLDRLMARTMSDFVLLPFSVEIEREPLGSDAFVGEISLSLWGGRSSGLELVLSVVVERAPMRRLALRVLGTDQVEDAESLVLESGNILMAAIRASLAGEGFASVLGLPRTSSWQAARLSLAGATLHTRVSLGSSIADVDVWLRAA